MTLPYLTIIFVVPVTLLLYRLLSIGRRPRDLPPGPPTVPILGNIHLLPPEDVHLQYRKWAQEYGPIYSLMMGTKPFIVISSDEIFKELLDRRSSNYSDRMDHYLCQEVLSGGNRMVLMHYGQQWRMVRKMVHDLLNIRKSHSYLPYQDLENKQMLVEMLDQPERFLDSVKRYATSLTTQMVFGFRTENFEDPKLIQLFESVNGFTLMAKSAAAALLEVFPIVRRLPESLVPSLKETKDLRTKEIALYEGHWFDCKERIAKGTAMPCFCTDAAAVQKEQAFSDRLGAYTAGSVLAAGSDTTSCTLYGFIQAMLLFPDIQKKAQNFLDQIVGNDRLPEMDDYQRLPYVRSCIKETLRWMPTAIMGFPHSNMQEDFYQGYRIPKGSAIIPNVYTIHMDPNRHPNPRVFDPDRYKEDNLSLAESAANPDPKKRDNFNFGGGRRFCQGVYLAERSLFLGIARILWAFDISPTKDINGNDILPDPDRLTQQFVCMPQPFPATIRPRSERKAELIRKTWEEVQDLLDPKTKQWVKLPTSLANGKR